MTKEMNKSCIVRLVGNKNWEEEKGIKKLQRMRKWKVIDNRRKRLRLEKKTEEIARRKEEE